MSNITVLPDSPESVCRPEPLIRSVRTTKIQPIHVERRAIVYVRQSTSQQVLEHQESLARQYDLAKHAQMLGWPASRIEVIDDDLGQSGRSNNHRSGFQRLLAEVALGHVGLVLGLEMSRLARSSKDWHHLLELCALFGTLLADQDGVYQPCDSNDRLLLGLKGTMSEFELFTMRNRLTRGQLHKAERGELFNALPSGYVQTSTGQVSLDPDEQVQSVLRLIFDKFDEIGTAAGLLKYLIDQGIKLGFRNRDVSGRGELIWRRPHRSTLFRILHNPIYAGAYARGQNVQDKTGIPSVSPATSGTAIEWQILIRDKLPAYITWERFEANQQRLIENRSVATSIGTARRGCALLAGLLVCGSCGRRFTVHYRHKDHPYYRCERHLELHCEQTCYGFNARDVDVLIGGLVQKVLEPAAIALHLQALDDHQHERGRLNDLWKKRLERAMYEAQRAERQYQAVEPENRLVARTLEKKWEDALTALRLLEDEYDRFVQAKPARLSDGERRSIEDLSQDIPALWNASETKPEDRKEIVRFLIEKVVADVRRNSETVGVTVHWQGGVTSEHQIFRTIQSYQQLRNATRLKDRIVRLRNDGHTALQIAQKLNQEGFLTRCHQAFEKEHVWHLMAVYGLSTKRDPIELEQHEWLLGPLAKHLGMNREKLREWIGKGWVHGRQTPSKSYWIVWADDDELKRIRTLNKLSHPGVSGYRGFPPELTKPKPR